MAQNDALVAYYKLDGNLKDEMGLSNGYFAAGNVADSANKFIKGYDGTPNGALFFGGKANEWCRVDLGTFSPVQLGTKGEMTVTFWAYWNGSTGSWQDIINKRDTWADTGMVWGINQHAQTGSVLSVRQPNSNADSKVRIPEGEWTFVAIETDGKNAYFFINGKLMDTRPYTYGTKYGAEIHMGTSPNGAVDAYNGALDDVGFYSRVLTETEVKNVMSSGKPIPVFSYLPDTVSTEDTVHFDASGSFDSAGKIVSYLWNFGDGVSDSGITASHLYKSTGNYTITLTVTDSAGNSLRREKVITVYSGKPIADFNFQPLYPMTGQYLTFDASNSRDVNGSIKKYQWDFGDGQTGSGVSVTHSFSTAGTYSVTLTVTDNNANSSDTTNSVTVYTGKEKPRVIATTDGERDDQNSMIRFLLYTDDWDVEGIIYSSSKFHWAGHNWSGTNWIQDDINLYSQVYPNLIKNDSAYPTADYLMGKVFVGNIDSVGEMSKETPGSNHIVDVLLDSSKPGPVWLTVWGGTNTIARALKTIQEKYPDKMNEVSKKAVIYIILDQDNTYYDYIKPNWPKIQVLYSHSQYRAFGYQWSNLDPQPYHSYFEDAWMKANITENHGPLCSNRYSQTFLGEGDSPSFIHLIPTGLRQMEDPSYGGWGGRFYLKDQSSTQWWGAEDDNDLYKPIYRWAKGIQNDFAARANWCINDYSHSNHRPKVNIVGGLNREVAAGSRVILNASGTTDPDGNALTFNWWEYADADNTISKVSISNSTSKDSASFIVPNEAGKEIHIILTVTDDGSPNLESYARIIFKIVSATSVKDPSSLRPKKFILSNNYPNPFNPSTNIKFQMPRKGLVTITVYNLLGQRVAILLNKYMNAGTHVVTFDGSGLASGVYIYQMKSGSFMESKKFVLLK